MPSQRALARLIAAPPSLVVTIAANAYDFLKTLPAANLNNTADTKALWAVETGGSAFGISPGSVFPSQGGTASTWIVSAEAAKRLLSVRF